MNEIKSIVETREFNDKELGFYLLGETLNYDDGNLFNKAFNLNLKEGEYNTLNGYIISFIGDIPKANDNIELKVDNINIEVVKVSNKKLETVRVRYIRKIN